MSKVRVRFAPSPTGYLHVGGLRTALYNYLFAKKNNGAFILRIEDTDQKRFVAGAAENLIKTLDAMGIQHDEGIFLSDDTLISKGECGPYAQSERLEIYRTHIKKLIDSHKAYYCFCSVGRLAALREEQIQNKLSAKYDKFCLSLSPEAIEESLAANEPYVVRLNVDENRGDIVFEDTVRGKVTIHARDVDDQVLIKSDGFPTYHLAVVTDDHLMGITHVIRGDEWISSTPKHVLLYEAFGWEAPVFAHLPLLLNPDKSKLSKRQGDVAAEEYLAKGYLKETLINFVALLGWNPGQGNTQEIFSLDELVERFDLAQVHKSGAVFDLKKLDWMNAEYIKRLSIDELYKLALPFIEKLEFTYDESLRRQSSGGQAGIKNQESREEFLKKVLSIEQSRLTKLSDIGKENPFFFASELTYDVALLHWKQNTKEMTREALEKARKILSELDETDWAKKEIIEKILMEAAGNHAQSQGGIEAGRGRGDFLWPLRAALTGAQRSPSPFEVAWVLGKEESLKRLKNALQLLS